MEMNYSEAMRNLSSEIQKELPQVRRDYSSSYFASLLMARHEAPSVEDAMFTEAKQRVLRNYYAGLAA
jgi:hypothetical protein